MCLSRLSKDSAIPYGNGRNPVQQALDDLVERTPQNMRTFWLCVMYVCAINVGITAFWVSTAFGCFVLSLFSTMAAMIIAGEKNKEVVDRWKKN